ncbi:RHS repeat-associated core domain-containing protein [[Pseudomonas] boreopolis]|uniref:RHS repeat-associated core domain-containing protein n=1 Tax=Xanthomonas boreopolis TaxID=86183 RepID=UPI003D4E07C2
MSIAAKHFDPQLGIDIHMYAMPPCPLPTPHIGLVLDPFDYLPFIGSTVKVGGVHRATAGTGGLDIHIPLGAWAPPMAAPMGPQFDGEEIFMGSRTVSADGEPFSRLAMPVLDCNLVGLVVPFRRKKPKKPLRALSLPTGLNVAIPTNVTVGGPPTVSWTALAFRGLFAGLGKLRKASFVRKKLDAFANWRRAKWGNLPPGFLKCKVLRAEPVDIRDGSVSVTHEDFSIPGRLPLPWRRVYSSREAAHAGNCGHGWQTPADIRLQLSADGSAWLSGPDEAALFPQLPAGDGMAHHVLDFVDGARLYREGVHLLVRFKDGRRYRFEHAPAPGVAVLPGDRTLPIARIEDACGNHWRFERRDGHLVRIVESGIDGLQGRFIEVEARQGRIERLQLHDPATGLNHPLVSYRYADGDLAAALDALDAARTFEYRQHRMVRHTDRVGLSFHYAYDAQWRVVHSWGDGGLYDYRFEYDDLLRETRLTDSLGHATVVKFDEHRLPLCEIDPLDGVTVFEYDDFGRTVAVTDPEGLRTGFEYDERGNLVALSRPDGSVLRCEYDELDHERSFIEPGNAVWRQAWDERDLLLEQITPMGAVSRYEYDAFGQLCRHIDASGVETRLQYDRYGNLIRIADDRADKGRFECDALGRVLRQHGADGNVALLSYDRKGRLLSVRMETTMVASLQYDAEDQLIGYTDEAERTTRLEYVGIGQLGRRVHPDGSDVRYRYDTEERLLEVTNATGQTYSLQRDALGRIVCESDYWGQPRRYRYDGASRLIATVDALGREIRYDNDGLGRVVARHLQDPDRPGGIFSEHYVYDARGFLREARNPHGAIKRRYDEDGCLVEEDQGGFVVSYGYDAAGRQVLRRSGAGNRILSVFDGQGVLASLQINDDAPIRIERDNFGRVVAEQLGEHLRRESTYDERGRLSSRKVLDACQSNLFETHYRYDRAGQLTERDDSRCGCERYTYDPMGRILSHVDPLGRIRRYMTDAAGERMRTEVRAIGALRVAGGDSQPEHWTRIGSLNGVDYEFDRVGNLALRDASGSRDSRAGGVEFRWDACQRLVESRSAAGTVRYGYDALGRRIFKRTATCTTRFFWDGDALLAEVDDDTEPEAGASYGHRVIPFERRRAQQRTMAVLCGRAREYVFHPASYVPLALIEAGGKRGDARAPSIAPVADSVDRNVPATARRTSKIESGTLGVLGAGQVLQGKGPERPASGLGVARLGMSFLGSDKMDAALADNLPPSFQRPVAAVSPEPGSVSQRRDDDNSPQQDASASSRKVYHYHTEPNGCPTRITDGRGKVVWEANYGAWGDCEITLEEICNPLRLQGQYEDVETGLHYNLNRYYDPHLGSFISKDPIGLAGGVGLYQYAPNTLEWIDPSGLTPGPVPDFDTLKHLANNVLDFSTKRDGAVFWSTPRMADAQRWAASVGKTTLEQTAGGKILDAWDLFNQSHITPAQAAEIWNIASVRFAEGASGDVHVFSTGATRFGPYGERTWWKIERPRLRQGLKTGRVTSIRRMTKEGFRVKGCRGTG